MLILFLQAANVSELTGAARLGVAAGAAGGYVTDLHRPRLAASQERNGAHGPPLPIKPLTS